MPPINMCGSHRRDFWELGVTDADRTALVDSSGAPVSYRELSRLAGEWAVRLRYSAGVYRPLIAIEFSSETDAIAAYLGTLRCGFPLLVLEPGQIKTDTSLEQVWMPDLRIASHASGKSILHEREGWRSSNPCLPHPDLRLLLSTSGSTGEPKLVKLSKENIASNAQAIAEYLQIRPEDRAAVTLPLYYSYGLSVLNSYLFAGGSLALIRYSVSEPAFMERAREMSVTSLALVPHQFELLQETGFIGTEIPTLRYMTQAGGKLPKNVVEHYWKLGRVAGWKLFIMYGQTEASPRISYVPPEALPEAADTIGRAIPGGQIVLKDEDGGEILGAGVPGELFYRGPNVMLGYALSREELTYGPTLSELATGDIAERTPAGYFRVVGRIKRFVKLFGLRLSLDRMESLLAENGIAANAVAVEDHLVIFLRLADQVATARAIVASTYELPESEVHADCLSELPLLSSGKPDQQRIKKIAMAVVERSLASQREMWKTAGIAQTMKVATRSSVVLPTDSFVSLGGDSLSYLRVQLSLEGRFGFVPKGWETMSIAELEVLKLPAAERANYVHIGADVFLRLLAMSMIIIHHATGYPVNAGAWILIVVMGYSMARFQLHQISEGHSVRIVARMLYPIVPLYFMLLIVYSTLREVPPLSYFLMVGNYESWSGGSLLVVYWFVSAYTQIVLLIALAARIPATRSAISRDPWKAAAVSLVGLIGVLIVLAFMNGGPGKHGLPFIPERDVVACLSMFCVGWMFYQMNGRSRIAVTATLSALTLALHVTLGMTLAVMITCGVSLIPLALKTQWALPKSVGRVVTRLASATLYVYLLHQFVVHAIRGLGLSQIASALLALIVSFTLAMSVKGVLDAVDGRLFGRRRGGNSNEVGVTH